MLWLAVVALAVWIFVQQRRLSAVERQLEDLRALPRPAARPAAFVGPVQEPVVPEASLAARDAPQPAAAAQEPIASPRPVEPVTLRAEAPEPVVRHAEPPPERPPGRPGRPAFSLESWLSENGLAWIGGGALTIGGALLVGFAAQQGYFTPPVRIAFAALLGLVLVLGGEAMRRGRLGVFGQHPLVPSIATGAGASVLYGTAWAAHALYGFIPAGACAALLAAIAGGLLALALKRGQALSLLALVGAFIAPLVAAGGGWATPVITAYLGLLIAVGLVVASERGWRLAGWTTIAGAGLWAGLAPFEPSTFKTLLLALEPLAVLAVLARLRPASGARIFAEGATVFASVLTALALAVAYGDLPRPDVLALAVFAGLALPGLAAVLIRADAVRPVFLTGPSLALVTAGAVGFIAHLQTPGVETPLLWLAQAATLMAPGLWAVRGGDNRAIGSAATALGVLGLSLLAARWLPSAAGAALPVIDAALPMLGACAALALGAAVVRRGPEAPETDHALEIWAGAAGAALLIAAQFGAGWVMSPVIFAAASALLGIAHLRFGQRSLAAASVIGAVLGFGMLFGPHLLPYGLAGLKGASWFLMAAFLAAGGALAAAHAIRLRGRMPAAAEGLVTLAVMAALTGLFVILRAVSAGAAMPLDPLTEASIRTLLLAASGLTGLIMLKADSGLIARLRAHGLLIAALAHAILLQVLAFNPWWGVEGHTVHGLPLLDSLTLGFLAPGLVFAVATGRAYRLSHNQGRPYVVAAAGFILLWATLEIRRFAHGGDLSGGPLTIGAGEACAYAILWLLVALGWPRLRQMRRAAGWNAPVASDLAKVERGLRWFAGALAVALLCAWSSPWWGPAATVFSGPVAALGVWIGYGLVTALLARMALEARRGADPTLANAAEVAAVLMGFTLVTLVIRWLFRGGDMTPSPVVMPAEIWTYSAVWALSGVGMLAVSKRIGRNLQRLGLVLLLFTAGKVLLFDMANLSGMVRVGSFIAVGVLMLAAALTARRIAGPRKEDPTPEV